MQNELSDTSVSWTKRLGEHLENSRRTALLSRRKVADRLGVTEETVRRWEIGASEPSPDTLARLIVILSIDAAQFTTLDQVPDEVRPLARMLKEERTRRAMTRDAAAAHLRVSRSTYASWESDCSVPSVTSLEAVASFTGRSRDELERLVDIPFMVDSANWSLLGRVIGRRRQDLTLTREQLARHLRVSQATIVAWELGYRTPRPEQLRSLAAALEIHPDELEQALPATVAPLTQFGRLIRAGQARTGLQLSEIARQAHVNASTLSRWIHGRSRPGPEALDRLASVLGIPVGDLRRAALC